MINNVKDILVFRFKSVNCFNLYVFQFASHFCPETTIENNQFLKLETLINNKTCSNKAFKGTIVNQALPPLHGGSHEITHYLEFSMVYF